LIELRSVAKSFGLILAMYMLNGCLPTRDRAHKDAKRERMLIAES